MTEKQKEELVELSETLLEECMKYDGPIIMLSLIMVASTMIAISNDPDQGLEVFKKQLEERVEVIKPKV